MRTYPIALEVSGPLAMWSRPDTGAAPTSYPAPTWSAVKGLLESIAFLASGEAWINPTSVEICRRVGQPGGEIRFQQYTTNYGGPLRHPKIAGSNSSMQVFATVLSSVCYRLYAEIEGGGGRSERNPRHHLQDLFQRRLKQGRCFRSPALGWREFTCDYWGAFRPAYEPDLALNVEIASMLREVWSQPHAGAYQSRFMQDVRIEKGLLTYAQ